MKLTVYRSFQKAEIDIPSVPLYNSKEIPYRRYVMGNDLNNARLRLTAGNYTCVLCKENIYYTSTRRGVAPLLQWLEEGLPLDGFSAADKVVGRAAALLYRLLGVRELYAAVISRGALEVLNQGGIAVCYDTLTDGIINRAGNGPCPMEAATRDITDPALAPAAIRLALQKLQQAH